MLQKKKKKKMMPTLQLHQQGSNSVLITTLFPALGYEESGNQSDNGCLHDTLFT